MGVIKITELTEVRWKTKHVKDIYGVRNRETVEYLAYRKVTTVSPGIRFLHYLIDAIVFQSIIYLIELVLIFLFPNWLTQVDVFFFFGMMNSLVIMATTPLLYCLFEYKWQKTPGKFLTKTVVIDEYGNKPSLEVICIRSLVRILPFEAFSCLGDNSYGWHDKFSETWVVKDAELIKIKEAQKALTLSKDM
jgi:uncharacterized RDD family membrane protein YckC